MCEKIPACLTRLFVCSGGRLAGLPYVLLICGLRVYYYRTIVPKPIGLILTSSIRIKATAMAGVEPAHSPVIRNCRTSRTCFRAALTDWLHHRAPRIANGETGRIHSRANKAHESRRESNPAFSFDSLPNCRGDPLDHPVFLTHRVPGCSVKTEPERVSPEETGMLVVELSTKRFRARDTNENRIAFLFIRIAKVVENIVLD